MKTITKITYPTLALLALAGFALSPLARAVDPPPDGGYPNQNTAEGDDALFSLTMGTDNTALGSDALYHVTTGYYNTAIGSDALTNNTTANGNTAIGWEALVSNTSGGGNMASGANALQNNSVGSYNTATGTSSLYANTTGLFNTAAGFAALQGNTTGTNNTACGSSALPYVTTGRNNIGLGDSAGSKLISGDNNIEIGNSGVRANESGTIRIGNQVHKRTFIGGISGVTVAGGVGVIIDTNGQLGTITSSKRFKESIRPMDKASEAILSLEPVTFRYKTDLDAKGIPQFGLVAEQVEKVDPDLVARDTEGKPYSVRYEAVNAMLLNEFLKEHRRVEKLESTVAELESALKEQTEAIRKVSERVAAGNRSLRVASVNQ